MYADFGRGVLILTYLGYFKDLCAVLDLSIHRENNSLNKTACLCTFHLKIVLRGLVVLVYQQY